MPDLPAMPAMPVIAALPVRIESASLLSPAAVAVLNAGGPDAYARLVVRGGGSAEGQTLLGAMRPSDIRARPATGGDAGADVLGAVASRTDEALLAGLLLWHDWLDASHTLSQGISTATGSFWHAIMHRREGDFSNAKYWYARCGGHPAHARFRASAAELAGLSEFAGSAALGEVAGRLRSGRDGYALVDLAEDAEDRPAGDPVRRAVVQLQRLEWAALFEQTLRER